MQITFLKKSVHMASMALCGMTVAFIGAATSAQGGLFNVPAEPADWNGPYFGFNAGVVLDHYDIGDYWGRVKLGAQLNNALMLDPYVDDGAETADPFLAYFYSWGHSDTDMAPIGGIHFGYNKQWGHFVGGFELGFEGTQTSKSAVSRSFQTNVLTDSDESDVEASTRFDSYRRAERNWDGWLGGQLGYAWGRFLFYANGGYTFADVSMYLVRPGPDPFHR